MGFTKLFAFIGDPERIRTADPQIRNLMLYPAELRGRLAFVAGILTASGSRDKARSPCISAYG